jgi:hypothetical protein
MMISKDKQYRTRDGAEVRIYATDAEGRYPVHGAWKEADGSWEMGTWTVEGRLHIDNHQNNSANLIEVRPRIKRTFWVNLYPGDNSPIHAHLLRSDADEEAGMNRIDCVEITIDCEEGEGL